MSSVSTLSFADRLKFAAQQAGGPDALSAKTSIPRRTLGNYLAGVSEPKVAALLAISKTSGVSIDWLVTGEGSEARIGASGGAEMPLEVVANLNRADEFVTVPRFDIQASAGPGAFSDRENVIDFMAFRADWVRRELRVDPAKLVLIRAAGDSMEPAIRAGDLLLIDTSVDQFIDDAIYVVVIDGALLVKRIQRFFGGAVAIRSDNMAYVEQTLAPGEAESIHVAGRVRWIGRLI